MNLLENSYHDTWGEFFTYLWSDLRGWWSRRRAFRTADRHGVALDLKSMSTDLYWLYQNGDRYDRQKAEHAMSCIERIADDLDTDLQYDSEDFG